MLVSYHTQSMFISLDSGQSKHSSRKLWRYYSMMFLLLSQTIRAKSEMERGRTPIFIRLISDIRLDVDKEMSSRDCYRRSAAFGSRSSLLFSAIIPAHKKDNSQLSKLQFYNITSIDNTITTEIIPSHHRITRDEPPNHISPKFSSGCGNCRSCNNGRTSVP